MLLQLLQRTSGLLQLTSRRLQLLQLTSRRGHQGADDEEQDEHADDPPQPLDQVHVCDLHRLRRPHPEYYRDPAEKKWFDD